MCSWLHELPTWGSLEKSDAHGALTATRVEEQVSAVAVTSSRHTCMAWRACGSKGGDAAVCDIWICYS